MKITIPGCDPFEALRRNYALSTNDVLTTMGSLISRDASLTPSGRRVTAAIARGLTVTKRTPTTLTARLSTMDRDLLTTERRESISNAWAVMMSCYVQEYRDCKVIFGE